MSASQIQLGCEIALPATPVPHAALSNVHTQLRADAHAAALVKHRKPPPFGTPPPLPRDGAARSAAVGWVRARGRSGGKRGPGFHRRPSDGDCTVVDSARDLLQGARLRDSGAGSHTKDAPWLPGQALVSLTHAVAQPAAAHAVALGQQVAPAEKGATLRTSHTQTPNPVTVGATRRRRVPRRRRKRGHSRLATLGTTRTRRARALRRGRGSRRVITHVLV